MRAVEFIGYGPAAQVLRINRDATVPAIAPAEVLIRVLAASVNPVDCAIRSGYGKEVFRFKGQVGPDLFPQRLGRDAAGIVEAVGGAVTNFATGDRVFCAPTRAAQADFIAVDASEVAHMPSALSFTEAASIPFVALTAWSALIGQGGLNAQSASSKRILITRGAGGVGGFAIQLMKAWGAYVATTGSARNVEYLKALGADLVIDYSREKIADAVRDIDVALDGAFDTEASVLGTLKVGSDAAYITIVSPKMRLIDEFGIAEGTRRADHLLSDRAQIQQGLGRRYYWGFMRPDGAALNIVRELAESGRIRALVDRVFGLDQIAEAHEYCESGQARGKIVMDLS
jgi:NADPH:quinone reductase-like Zn-dependent oxidoreductase